MQMFRTSFRVVFCLVAVFCMAQTGNATEASRIELHDGTVYENAVFTVDNTYRTVDIKSGDWTRTVSMTEIAQILAPDGTDITADYIENYVAPESATEIVGDEAPGNAGGNSTRARRKTPFSAGIRVGANYSFPIGTWFDGFKSAVGFDVDVFFPVSSELAIRGSLSKAGLGMDDMNLFADGQYYSMEVSADVWRYLVSVQWYKWPQWRGDGKTMYSFWTGLGVTDHKLSAGGASVGESKFTLTTGGSIMTLVAEKTGIEFGAGFDVLYIGSVDGAYGSSGFQRAGIFDLKIGLVQLF